MHHSSCFTTLLIKWIHFDQTLAFGLWFTGISSTSIRDQEGDPARAELEGFGRSSTGNSIWHGGKLSLSLSNALFGLNSIWNLRNFVFGADFACQENGRCIRASFRRWMSMETPTVEVIAFFTLPIIPHYHNKYTRQNLITTTGETWSENAQFSCLYLLTISFGIWSSTRLILFHNELEYIQWWIVYYYDDEHKAWAGFSWYIYL